MRQWFTLYYLVESKSNEGQITSNSSPPSGGFLVDNNAVQNGSWLVDSNYPLTKKERVKEAKTFRRESSCVEFDTFYARKDFRKLLWCMFKFVKAAQIASFFFNVWQAERYDPNQQMSEFKSSSLCPCGVLFQGFHWKFHCGTFCSIMLYHINRRKRVFECRLTLLLFDNTLMAGLIAGHIVMKLTDGSGACLNSSGCWGCPSCCFFRDPWSIRLTWCNLQFWWHLILMVTSTWAMSWHKCRRKNLR